jgi:hypothetical protein
MKKVPEDSLMAQVKAVFIQQVIDLSTFKRSCIAPTDYFLMKRNTGKRLTRIDLQNFMGLLNLLGLDKSL